MSTVNLLILNGLETPEAGRTIWAAQELRVDVVVEGSALRSCSGVRITAELVDAACDKHLWAVRYERVTYYSHKVRLRARLPIHVELTPAERLTTRPE